MLLRMSRAASTDVLPSSLRTSSEFRMYTRRSVASEPCATWTDTGNTCSLAAEPSSGTTTERYIEAPFFVKQVLFCWPLPRTGTNLDCNQQSHIPLQDTVSLKRGLPNSARCPRLVEPTLYSVSTPRSCSTISARLVRIGSKP